MNAQRKTAVVTGASSGIGLGIAKALLGRSWNVVGNARTQPRLDEAATLLGAGERFSGVAGDIAKPHTSKRLFDSAIDRFGHVDLLVNNAGIFLPKPFVDFTPDEIEEQIATNVKGVIFASQEAARRMIASREAATSRITAALAMQPRAMCRPSSRCCSGRINAHAQPRTRAGAARYPRQRGRAGDHRQSAAYAREPRVSQDAAASTSPRHHRGDRGRGALPRRRRLHERHRSARRRRRDGRQFLSGWQKGIPWTASRQGESLARSTQHKVSATPSSNRFASMLLVSSTDRKERMNR
jgi:NAD(P)-dependent dehydrogenase (short-subunit alcohol dehydrogenase family)